MVIIQKFNWHAQTGSYRYGDQGYLVMDDGPQHEGIQCSRKLAKPITDSESTIELRLRVVVGKRYAIRLYSSTDQLAAQLVITEGGWLQFNRQVARVSTDFYLTWFNGRPVVDPDFVPEKSGAGAKTIESDEHSFRFGDFGFEGGTFSFSFDGSDKKQIPATLKSDIARLELVAFPCQDAGNRIRLKQFVQTDGKRLLEVETFPIYWEPVEAIPPGYPDDNTRAAATRPYGYHWLECSGEYCWVRGHLPHKLDGTEYELTFDLQTPDVDKETCVELHQDDGTMAQSMLPVKVGIIGGKFFSGFASRVTSSVLGKDFWKSQQALYPQIAPEPDKTYNIRIRWNNAGYYSWWVNDTPMRFSGIAKTGVPFSFPGYELPGFRIPFLNELVRRPFSGFDTIALHYGLVSPSSHVAYYGNFRVAPVDER